MTYLDAYFQYKLLSIVVVPVVFVIVVGGLVLVGMFESWWYKTFDAPNKKEKF
jgi:hypothetical protein